MAFALLLDAEGATAVRAELHGGGGDDAIAVNAQLISYEKGRVSTLVTGNDGRDRIDASAVLTGMNDHGVARNAVHGGANDDTIVARAVGDRSGTNAVATNLIDCGSGHDRLRAIADAGSTRGGVASNEVHGRSGDDYLRSVLRSDAWDSVRHGADVDGGGGNDRVSVVSDFGGSGTAVGIHSIAGGGGDDTLSCLVSADGPAAGVEFDNTVSGASGDDLIRVEISIAGAGMEAACENRVAGGEGDDTIASLILVGAETGGGDADLLNRVDGGGGNDTITGQSQPAGRSVLIGGDGHDTLIVLDGFGNRLDGGAGRDRLIAGAGDDILLGGEGADTFCFEPFGSQGADTIRDFDKDRDRLLLFGMTDRGKPGLADDFADAVAWIVDDGTDVVVTLIGRTTITFENCGTGAVETLDDLVADPATQLVTAASLL